jgi:phosphoserine aminotransferase
VREDLLGHARKITPTVFDYKITADNKSLYNTPPTHGLHVAGLVYEWVLKEGGVAVMEQRAARKSERLYKAIDSSRLFIAPVHPSARSRMNVVFRIKHENAAKLEDEFCQEAHARGLEQLKGHRSVGGLRASLYNAVPEEAVEALVTFMKEFEEKHVK